MTIYAIIVFILFIILSVLPVVFNKKVSYFLSTRKFTISLGAFLLLIFFGFRYVWYIIDFVQFTQFNKIPDNLLLSQYDVDKSLANYNIMKSIIYGNLMFTNVTDLFMILIPFSLIFFGNKAITRVFANVSYACVSWYLIFLIFSQIDANVGYGYLYKIPEWKYIFVSNGITRFPIIINLLLILTSSLIIVGSKENSRWSMFSSLLVCGLVISYIVLIASIYSLRINASGFSTFDWSTYTFTNKIVNYGPFSPINNVSDNKIALDSTLFSIINSAIWFGLLIIILAVKNLFTSSILKTNFIFRPWYINSNKYIKIICSFIDANINNFLWKFMRSNYLSAGNKFSLSMQISIIFNKKSKEKAIANLYIQEQKELKAKLKEEKKKQKEEQKLINAMNKKFDEEFNNIKSDNEQIKKEINNMDNKDEIKVSHVVNEPFLENDVWWYIDEQGNKYYANDNQWILSN